MEIPCWHVLSTLNSILNTNGGLPLNRLHYPYKQTHCKYQLDVQGDGHRQTVFVPAVCNIGLKNVAARETKFHWVYPGETLVLLGAEKEFVAGDEVFCSLEEGVLAH
ncbi:hypothetical protein E2542_SST14710 [Spatholobus suberectus]|nr:hypothetical protein E2542_SST14710 [Spatholobus suberectus]